MNKQRLAAAAERELLVRPVERRAGQRAHLRLAWLTGVLGVLACSATDSAPGGKTEVSAPMATPSSVASEPGGQDVGGGPQPGSPPVPFAPAPGAYRRLTSTAFVNSLRDLLGGPVTVDTSALEPDSWEVGGLPTVSAASVSISHLGVEQYQTAIDSVTSQVFADAARRDQLLGCAPKSGTDLECFRSFVSSFGRRAFRRPLTPAQVDRYTQLIASVAAALGDTYEGMRAGMTGLLLSPNFLYRLERGEPSPSGDGSWRYTSSEIAARLSYFLTSSTPDSTLLDLADQDGLQTPDAVRAQAERLLSTPAGRQSIGDFAKQLFQLQIIAARAKDAVLYSEYTPDLQSAMIREISAMFESLVFDEDASALDLFTTRNTFVTRELAELYGLPTTGLSSNESSAAQLPADGMRAGLFGTAGFLSLYASQKEGSPTQRGKFIRNIVLCQTIPPPPPNVNAVLQEPPPGVVLTKRERLALHQTSPVCSGCHSLMDPLGLTLENFDAIGKFRTTDHDLPIDVSGSLDGKEFSGPIELGQMIADKPETAACLVRNLYRYGTGHVEIATEAPVLDELTERFRGGGHRLRELMLDLVSSDAFRYVAPPAP